MNKQVRKIIKSLALIAMLMTGFLSQAQAAMIRFDLQWGPADFSSTAWGEGYIELDDSLVTDAGFHVINPLDATVGDIFMRIGGSSVGNGWYYRTDFIGIVWGASAVLDLSQELVGQLGFDDMNFFADPASSAPDGSAAVAPFSMLAGNGLGEGLLLLSMKIHVIPAPAAWLLMLMGLAGFSVKNGFGPFKHRRKNVAL